jgi:translation initiation factor 4E
VGEFWQVFSHFRRPIVMPIGTVLHFFVDGIKPLWEDENCKEGGRITLRFPNTHTAKFWEDTVMALVGE